MKHFDELFAFKEEFEEKRQRLENNTELLTQLYNEGSIQKLDGDKYDTRTDIKERIDHLVDVQAKKQTEQSSFQFMN